MAKYICPVCGKIWYNVKDLAQCTAADAKTEEVNQKARETKLKMINGLKVDNDDEYYNNKEIELLLYALGINPDPNKLRYGKIAICVDADDGYHIALLTLATLYRICPRDKERLATYKAELDKAYAVLKSKLDVYNSAAAAYNGKYEDKVATYTSTLTSNFSSIFSNGSKTKTQTLYNGEISKLIAEKLGF